MAAQHGTQTPIAALDILWITAGLGCDGDTIAMTAATQPSLEDLLLGAIPWTPKVRLYNPFFAIENGDEFMAYSHHAADGKSETPFILVVEGLVPNENNKEEGYWASFGTDPKTRQPILTCEWIDRLAPKAWAVQSSRVNCPTSLTAGRNHARTVHCDEHRRTGPGGSRRTRRSSACRAPQARRAARRGQGILLFSYEVACADTPLKGSRLVIDEIPVIVFCPNCQARRPLSSLQLFCCAECGTPTPDVVQGKELQVVALEIAE